MIFVIGEVLIDVFDDYQRIGGAPFNFAFHLKQLGWPVRLITRVGDDRHGKDILALMDRNGFSLDDVQIDPRHATGTVQVILDPDGVPQFDIRGNVAYDHIDPEAVGPIDWHEVAMIYFGSLAQRTPEGFQCIQHFVTQRMPHTKVFCDINLRPPHINAEALKESLRQTDILKLNTEELDTLCALFGGDDSDNNAVDWITGRFSIETVILTHGSQGSAIHKAGQHVGARPHQGGRVVDTVGAGDAYAAVSAAWLLCGLPLQTVVDKASEFAAHICSLAGAVPDDTSMYAALRKSMEG